MKKIAEFLSKKDEKIFGKHNINTSAKIILMLIEDEIQVEHELPCMQEKLITYLNRLDDIYKESFIESPNSNCKTSCLKEKILEEYSILKYFFEFQKEILLNLDLFLSEIMLENKKENDLLKISLEIPHISTGEIINLSRKNKKMLLDLLKNSIITRSVLDCPIELETNKKENDYLVAKSENIQKII